MDQSHCFIEYGYTLDMQSPFWVIHLVLAVFNSGSLSFLKPFSIKRARIAQTISPINISARKIRAAAVMEAGGTVGSARATKITSRTPIPIGTKKVICPINSPEASAKVYLRTTRGHGSEDNPKARIPKPIPKTPQVANTAAVMSAIRFQFGCPIEGPRFRRKAICCPTSGIAQILAITMRTAPIWKIIRSWIVHEMIPLKGRERESNRVPVRYRIAIS